MDAELRSTGALVRRSRPRQLAGALLGTLVFTALGVWLVVQDDGVPSTLAGVAGVLFFGVVGVPVLGWRLVTGQPVLRVDAGLGLPAEPLAAWLGELSAAR